MVVVAVWFLFACVAFYDILMLSFHVCIFMIFVNGGRESGSSYTVVLHGVMLSSYGIFGVVFHCMLTCFFSVLVLVVASVPLSSTDIVLLLLIYQIILLHIFY